MKLKKMYAIVAMLIVVATVVVTFRVYAQKQSTVLSFATQDWGYVIFDHRNARIYVYNARNGELTATWKINHLGQALERVQ